MECKLIEGYRTGFLHLACADSTNLVAKREAQRLFADECRPDVLVVSADEQTAGRGQQGTVWHSSRGENLLLSIVVRPSSLIAAESYALSVVAALALNATVAGYGVESVIKWPNDLYCKGKKLAGILSEVDFMGSAVAQAVVGIGLNVNQKQFCEMSRRPISLSLAAGRDFDCVEVKRRVVGEFMRHYAMMERGRADELFAAYENMLMGRRENMLFRDAQGVFEARVESVQRDGRLILRRCDGTLSCYSFKEVESVVHGY